MAIIYSFVISTKTPGLQKNKTLILFCRTLESILASVFYKYSYQLVSHNQEALYAFSH